MINRMEPALSAPPVAVAGYSLLGFSLPEWAAIVTIIYTVLLIVLKLRQVFGKKGEDEK